MARPKNTSRITPKGTRPEGQAPPRVPIASGPGASPAWMGYLIGIAFLIGIILIVSNYMSWLPGAPSSGWILGGLGFVLVGIVTATRWR